MTAETQISRVAALVARFEEIGATTMRGMPIYNDGLRVEAVGFRLWDTDLLIGVLVTPWFMNLLLLPVDPVPMTGVRLGRRETVDLPAGPRPFLWSGDEALGAWRSHSLVSPMDRYQFHEAAVVEGRESLAAALTPPEPDSGDVPDPGRRRMLGFGRSPVHEAS